MFPLTEHPYTMQSANESDIGTKLRVLAIGDSLTVGQNDYVTRGLQKGSLFDVLNEICDGTNAGSNGYSSRMMKKELESIFQQCDEQGYEPDSVTLWAGANDAVAAPSTPQFSQHVPLDEYRSNLGTMISEIKSKWTEASVILITPPPAIPEVWLEGMKSWHKGGPEPVLDRSVGTIKSYADECRSLGESLAGSGVYVVDAWDAVERTAGGLTRDDLEQYYIDGLHLNADGYNSVNDRVVSIINALSLKRSSQPVSHRTRSQTAETAVTTAEIRLPNWRTQQETWRGPIGQNSQICASTAP